MPFKMKFLLRKWYLDLSFWSFGVFSGLLALVYIKYQKFDEFAGYMYSGANLDNPKHLEFVENAYFNSDIYPLRKWIVIAFICELVVRSIVSKSLKESKSRSN